MAPLFFLIVFGIIDMARLYNAWVTLQGAAREGARYGVTGRSDCAIASDDRYQCILYLAKQRTMALANASSDVTVRVRSWDYPAYADPPTENDPGGQCDALEVQVEYDFTPATPLLGSILGSVHLSTRERLVNEPFGPCAT